MGLWCKSLLESNIVNTYLDIVGKKLCYSIQFHLCVCLKKPPEERAPGILANIDNNKIYVFNIKNIFMPRRTVATCSETLRLTYFRNRDQNVTVRQGWERVLFILSQDIVALGNRNLFILYRDSPPRFSFRVGMHLVQDSHRTK